MEKVGSSLSRNIKVISISAGIWALGGRMRGPFFPLYVLALGGNYFQIGLIATVGSIFKIIASFLGGYLSDTIGRKKIIYTMGFLISLDTILYLLSPSWEYLILASALNSMFVGLRAPSMTAIIADSTKAETRTKGFMVDQVLRITAGSISPIIVGIFFEKYGVLTAQRLAYLCAFITSFIATTIRYLYLEETLLESSKKLELKSVIRETYNGFKTTIYVLPKQVWIIIVSSIIFTTGASLGASFFVTYAIEDVIGLTASNWGLIYGIMSIISVISMVMVAPLSDRYGRLKFIIPAMFLIPICLVSFIYSRTFTQVLLVMSTLAIFGSMMASPFKALLFDYSPREHRGRIYTLSNIISSLPGDNIVYQGPAQSIMNGISNMIGGIAYGRFKVLPFYMEAVLIWVSAIFSAIFIKDTRTKQK